MTCGTGHAKLAVNGDIVSQQLMNTARMHAFSRLQTLLQLKQDNKQLQQSCSLQLITVSWLVTLHTSSLAY